MISALLPIETPEGISFSYEAASLLEGITAFAGRDRGAGRLVRALALRQTGREAEGRKLLADWAPREPASAVASWSARAFDGTLAPLPEGAGEDLRVIAAWLQGAPRRTP